MTQYLFLNAAGNRRLPDRFLNHTFMNAMTPYLTTARINRNFPTGKNVLPPQLFCGIRVLPFQGIRQKNRAKSALQVFPVQLLPCT